jgi:ribonuclease HII
MPDFKRENALGRTAGRRIAGLDEVGRGPLAGPVVAAAVVLPARLPRKLKARLDDSKAILPEERTAIAAALAGYAEIALGRAEVAEIDTLNILHASMLAMQRALAGLAAGSGGAPDACLVDGNRLPPDLPCPGEAVVGGDGLCLSIAAASIVAKVARDAEMVELAEAFPGYGWETNMGYSCKAHYAGLNRLGACLHHRRSFTPVRLVLAGETVVYRGRKAEAALETLHEAAADLAAMPAE